MSDTDPARLLELAMDVAYAGGRRTLGWYNNQPRIEFKDDGSPVTEADREAEQLMRDMIRAACPTHSIVGEELGIHHGTAPVRWTMDPIDGTKTFIQGVPFYGTLIGVEVEGDASVGVVFMPALDEMVAAARGLGCTWNGRRARVSTVDTLQQSFAVITDGANARRRSGAWDAVTGATRMQRTWGDCYGYVLVATGRAEVALDPVLNLWDCAALMPIVEEAGGVLTDWRGRRTHDGGDCVATNGHVHPQILPFLDDGGWKVTP